ncbi:helix-turn-helix domain-containing protein [Nocardia sp. NPDC057440]|uniref:helix-turn-helix domain-containing protein n=1 Tax=Nocardia sp. NPDC057440 TaxID=3346134 RepID=UPI00366D6C35
MSTAARELPDRYAAAEQRHRWNSNRKVVDAPTLTAPIALIRSGLGISLDQMAAKVGVSRSYLCRVETGSRTPTPELLAAIETFLLDQLRFRKK